MKAKFIKPSLMAAIAATATISSVVPTYAAEMAEDTGFELTYEFGENNTYFKTDKDFNKYFEDIKTEISKHPDSPSSFIELHHFLAYGGATASQVKSVVDAGYLTEYIDEFKESGYLPADYKFEGTKIETPTFTSVSTGTTVTDEASIPEVLYGDRFRSDLDADTIKVISDLLYDNDPDDTVVYVYDDTKTTTKFPAGLIANSGYNREPLTVSFIDENNNPIYAWTFDHEIFATNGDQVDLAVTNKNGLVTFDLGKKMPQPLAVSFKVDKANAKYNIVNTKTKEKAFYKSDENKMITITDDDGTGSYSYEYVREEKQDANYNDPKIKDIIGKKIDSKALIAIVLLLGLSGLGLIGSAIVSFIKKRRL